MGKVILEFDSIEEQDDIKDALDGYKWKLAIRDLDQELRKTTKHGQSIIDKATEASELEYEIADKYREMIIEILENYNLLLD